MAYCIPTDLMCWRLVFGVLREVYPRLLTQISDGGRAPFEKEFDLKTNYYLTLPSLKIISRRVANKYAIHHDAEGYYGVRPRVDGDTPLTESEADLLAELIFEGVKLFCTPVTIHPMTPTKQEASTSRKVES
jgi:hypothetical protein